MASTTQAEHHQGEQFDFFIASLIPDLPLKDQRESMERPFFSLSKRKRLKSIDYTSPAGVHGVDSGKGQNSTASDLAVL